MVNPVANTTPPQLVEQAKPVETKTQVKPQSADNGAAATVQVSNAALAALKEATETQAVTMKEASSGDRQAQKLLAKEAAAKQQ
ncbi:MAG: hypothetical protein HQL09_07895 [Nitrospirae bacterium]|nr:hypothetical protein [Nitrospirota bacterium]